MRVTAPTLGMHAQTATLESLPRDTLWLAVEDSLVVCPLTAVTRIERFVGIRSHWVRGMGIGFLAGTAVGAGVGAVATSICKGGDTGSELCELWYVVALPAGAVVGLLAGTLVGHHTKWEHWSTVPIDQLRVQPIAYRRADRIQFGVSVAF